MYLRIIRASALALALVACAPKPPRIIRKPLPTAGESLAGKCSLVEKAAWFSDLQDEEQKWVRECVWAFQAKGGGEASKLRVHLALDFRLDRELRRDVSPVEWNDLWAATRDDLVAVEKLAKDGEAVALSARWRGEVMNDREGAFALACKAAQLSPALFDAQLGCGDYSLRAREDVPSAVHHWKLAYPLAERRTQQCQVVERVLDHSLRPEVDLEGMSKAVVDRCLLHAKSRARRDEADELREAARELREVVEQARQAAHEAAEAPARQETAAGGQK